MTEPSAIRRDRVDTDAILHQAMTDAHCESPNVRLEGRLWRAARRAQREAMPAYAIERLGKAAGKQLAKYLAGRAGALPGAIIEAGKETLKAAYRNLEDGNELLNATLRAPAYFACGRICAGILPQGYVCDLDRQMLDGDYSAALTQLKKRPDYERVAKGIQENCRDGQRAGIERHLRSVQELETLLKSPSSEFAKRYGSDLAFKLGVDSVIWAAQHGERIDVAPAPEPITVVVSG